MKRLLITRAGRHVEPRRSSGQIVLGEDPAERAVPQRRPTQIPSGGVQQQIAQDDTDQACEGTRQEADGSPADQQPGGDAGEIFADQCRPGDQEQQHHKPDAGGRRRAPGVEGLLRRADPSGRRGRPGDGGARFGLREEFPDGDCQLRGVPERHEVIAGEHEELALRHQPGMFRPDGGGHQIVALALNDQHRRAETAQHTAERALVGVVEVPRVRQ